MNIEPVKKLFKINILGSIRFEADNMTTKDILLVCNGSGHGLCGWSDTPSKSLCITYFGPVR